MLPLQYDQNKQYEGHYKHARLLKGQSKNMQFDVQDRSSTVTLQPP